MDRFSGTAGVPPASSSGFAQVAIESDNFNDVAFHLSGRDARGPRQSLACFGMFASLPEVLELPAADKNG